MKKLFLTIFLSLLFAGISKAQTKGDITLAPQLGVNITTYLSNDYSYSARVALSAGVVGDYFFSDRWSLRTGLLFDAMGAKDDYNYTDKLNYLSLPLNANWHFGKKRNWYLNFGPSVSFLISAKSEVDSEESSDIKDYISPVDVGLGVGIGYIFTINAKLSYICESIFNYEDICSFLVR